MPDGCMRCRHKDHARKPAMNRTDRRIRKAQHWGRPMTTTTELKTSCRLLKRQLRSTTVLPVVMGLGVAAAGAGLGLCGVRSVKAAPSASTVLPEAISRDGLSEGVRTVACNPCNPCAPNPCNPCAAANPCNPCAAANPCNPCAANPCNPCAAGGAGRCHRRCHRMRRAASRGCQSLCRQPV